MTRSNRIETPRDEPSPGWATLFRCVAVESALAEIARQLGFVAEEAFRVGAALAVEAEDDRVAIVPGRPPWRLTAATASALPYLREAARRLDAWRAARLQVERAVVRVESRARDLETLHVLGRTLSECRDPRSLLRSVADVLHERLGVDAVGWCHRFDGGGVDLGVARPLGEEALRVVGAVARGALGVEDGPVRAWRIDGFDEARGARESVEKDEAIVLPLPRRGAFAASLVVVPQEVLGERSLRFVYGAANALALHLDRVLTVLEAEHGRFRSILDSMPQSVILADRDLRILQVNAAAEGLLRKVGSGGTGAFARLDGLDLAALARTVVDGAPEACAEAKLSSGMRLSVTVSPLSGENARVEGLVLVCADVTDARRLQDQLAQSEKLSSLGRMLSGVAHELNNPLTSVLGFSEMARSTPPGEKLDRRLTLVHEEARRCQKIVQNLLRFARRHEPERKPLSLNEVVKSTAALLGYQLRVDGVHLSLELVPDLPMIHGDVHELQQAIVNLVTNAHQALAGRNGGRVAIRTLSVGTERVRLEVADDGPGIPEAIRSRIFDPFFTTKAPGQGTGLGLSLVYGTVTAHGGTIEAEEGPGGGATFVLELPVGAAAPVAAASVAPSPAAATVSGHILVVDDERALAEMIREALEADGHRVVTACDAAEVLASLGDPSIDLVVSDLKMPGLGAERLYDALRERRPGLERRLLLTTGDTVSREPEAFAERVGAELVHKPFAPEEIRRRVRKNLAAGLDH